MANYATTGTNAQSMVSTLFKSLYMQMAAALTITGLTAYFLSQCPQLLSGLHRQGNRTDRSRSVAIGTRHEYVYGNGNHTLYHLLGAYGCYPIVDIHDF